MSLPAVCILAGGLGTRLGELVAETPKPLLEVAGEPFLMHQLRLLAAHGASDVVLCVGYHGELIEERIGSSQFGVRIAYSYDGPKLLGTLGAVRRALPLLPSRFLVMYGDTYLRLDYRAAAREWEASGLPGLMTVYRNAGQWDTSNVLFERGRVVAYDKFAPTADMQWIDYGLGGLEAGVVERADRSGPDLAALYTRLAQQAQLFGYPATERFLEIGTPWGLADTARVLAASGAGIR